MAIESSVTVDVRASRQSRTNAATRSIDSPYTLSAPKRLASHGHPATDQTAWRAWQKHLIARRRPRPIAELFSGKVHPLLWCVPPDTCPAAVVELLSAATSANGEAAELASASFVLGAMDEKAQGLDATEVLCELALVHLLPKMAGNLDAHSWWRLLERLCARAAERRSIKLDETVDGSAAWADQVLAGELPLTLVYLFPELRVCDDLAASACHVLSDGLIALTDGEGLVHAAHLPWLRPLFACWTRCLAMASAARFAPWSDDAQVQYDWLVRQALRLSRSDGSQLFGAGPACHWQPELFRAALVLTGDDEDSAAARQSLPGDLKIADTDELPCEPAVSSEWSQLAVLRTSWKRAAARIAVAYSQDVAVELEVGRESLFAGVWDCDVVSDGKPLARDGQWQEVCWFSDDDVDYLELTADLVGGGRVDRQILLAREDHFLYLCDNAIDVPAASIECASRLPLAPSTEVSFEQETREAELGGRAPRAVVLPLALPEWRTDPRGGELEQHGRALQLRQRTAAQSLACPLFIDLLPRRLRKQRTWRQLTVAESLEICPRERAVAYRAQCGLAQWVFYRSLAAPANRTFFGQNISTEFFAARFHRDGEVEELLEIEGEEE